MVIIYQWKFIESTKPKLPRNPLFNKKLMKVKRGQIILKNIQIKSLEKAQKLAQAINTIEEECGIHEVNIKVVDPFICPWIDLGLLNNTPMETLLSGILLEIIEKSIENERN